MKPSLLVVTSTFPRWIDDSDPPFVFELSKRLTDTFDVTVLAPHYPGAKRNETIEHIAIHRFRYFFSPFEKLAGSTGILPSLRNNKLYFFVVPFFVLAQFFSLLLLVRRNKPQIIHAHWIIPQGMIAIFVRILTGVPVVVTAHGGDIFGLQGKFFEICKKFTLTQATAVTVVSKAVEVAASSLVHINNKVKIKIIPMGVSSSLFNLQEKNDKIREKYNINGPFLLFVGRLTEKKGVPFLIDAMRKVTDMIPEAKLLIVGTGELKEQLIAQVAHLQLEKAVFFTGKVTNRKLPDFYAQADLFIGPSIQVAGGDTEGFGLTFVEAAMSGCIIVGTNVGGIGDIIEDNVTGFLVPEQDTVALANKIIFVLNDCKTLHLMRKSSQKRCIEKYDWNIIAGRYSHLLLESINK